MFERILAIGAHPDDVEFGAGGVISKFIEQGKDVFYIAFSPCKKSIPKGYPKDILKFEMAAAAKALGIEEKNVSLLDYEVRMFPRFRQEILEDLIKINRDLSPDLVLTPSPNDIHQDHRTISIESFRAFKRTSSIWGYEIPWNTRNLVRTTYVLLHKRHLDVKIDALSRYKSQIDRLQLKELSLEEMVRITARTIGFQVGLVYAEAFNAVRTIIA